MAANFPSCGIGNMSRRDKILAFLHFAADPCSHRTILCSKPQTNTKSWQITVVDTMKDNYLMNDNLNADE